jgi:hypothetical protein
VLNEALASRVPGIAFYENDLTPLNDGSILSGDCELLILNLIAGTGNQPLAGAEAEKSLRVYLERGNPLLLVHGGSAAFWHWPWWRSIVGYRWVRGDDPDGFAPSTHPTRGYRLDVSKARHPLCKQLKSFDVPEDEIYIRLEQTCPATVLMETTTVEGTFPQCYECTTAWGGRVIGFLPGHKPQVAGSDDVAETVATLIRDLTRGK